jgi:hypothetical protein
MESQDVSIPVCLCLPFQVTHKHLKAILMQEELVLKLFKVVMPEPLVNPSIEVGSYRI